MSPADSFWDLMRALPCTYCHALAGEPCHTRSGARTSVLHSARYYLAKQRLNTGCQVCGTTVEDGSNLCPRCDLVRALEVERSTVYKRAEP